MQNQDYHSKTNYMYFHGIKSVDKYHLSDFLPVSKKLREGAQVIFESGYRRGKQTLIMADSEKDSAYKLNVEDIVSSHSFLSLLNDEDKALVIRLSELTEKELSFLHAEEEAHAYDAFMNMDRGTVIYDHAVNIESWKLKNQHCHFTVCIEAENEEIRNNHQLETFPSPRQALAYLNSVHQAVCGDMYINITKSF